MKNLIIALLLLAAAPALASPRHPTPAQLRDKHALTAAYGACFYRTDPEVVRKACATMDRLDKKLSAQGFCLVGKGEVGRAGGPVKGSPGDRHCYRIH